MAETHLKYAASIQVLNAGMGDPVLKAIVYESAGYGYAFESMTGFNGTITITRAQPSTFLETVRCVKELAEDLVNRGYFLGDTAITLAETG